MAIRVQKKQSVNAVEVILRNDDALDLDQSDYDGYSQTGDVNKLVFLPNKKPTIFLCNFELKSKQAEVIKNKLIGGYDENGQPLVALGSWSFRIVKTVLKDIKNPDGLTPEEILTFKTDKDGLVHDDLMGDLDKVGAINAIFGMYSTLTNSQVKNNAKN